MSDITQLETIRDQTLQEIEDATAAPSATMEVNGTDIEWDDYIRSLRETLDWCDRKIAEYQAFEITSEGST